MSSAIPLSFANMLATTRQMRSTSAQCRLSIEQTQTTIRTTLAMISVADTLTRDILGKDHDNLLSQREG
jgi:hypothetical protein